MQVQVEGVRAGDVVELLREHLAEMHRNSPPGSVYALDLEGLEVPSITFYTARDDGGELLGIGALKELDERTGEIKSMRTASRHLRKGAAAALLRGIVDEAEHRGYARLMLETGRTEPFHPAIRLYELFGFEPCESFADYVATDFNRFMQLDL